MRDLYPSETPTRILKHEYFIPGFWKTPISPLNPENVVWYGWVKWSLSIALEFYLQPRIFLPQKISPSFSSSTLWFSKNEISQLYTSLIHQVWVRMSAGPFAKSRLQEAMKICHQRGQESKWMCCCHTEGHSRREIPKIPRPGWQSTAGTRAAHHLLSYKLRVIFDIF